MATPRKTTQRTARNKKGVDTTKINDADTLKDTQQVNEIAREQLGTSVSPTSFLYQKSQFDVGGPTPNILRHLANPPIEAVEAQEASGEIHGNQGDEVVISTRKIPEGQVDKPFNKFTINARGGAKPYSFKLSAGSLPEGLYLSKEGEVTGTPTTAGEEEVTINATDSKKNSVEKEYTFTVNAAPSDDDEEVPEEPAA